MRHGRCALGLLPWFVAVQACGNPLETGARRPVTGTDSPQPVSEARSAARTLEAQVTRERLAPSLDCPEETTAVQLEIPLIQTVMAWCVKAEPEGVRVQHGPWEKRRFGRVVEAGRYRDGLRDGTWRVNWSSGGPQSEGEFRAGHKAGLWTFWDESGEVIRRVDYGSPAAEARAVAEEEDQEVAEQPAEPTAEVSLIFENTQETDLLIALQPSAEEYAMPPGSTLEVSAVGPASADLVVESAEELITVWTWEGSEVQLWFNGEELLP